MAVLAEDAVYLAPTLAFVQRPHNENYGNAGGRRFDVTLTDAWHINRALLRAVTKLSDGRYAATGSVGAGDDLALAIFNADGSLDTAFGDDGFVRIWGNHHAMPVRILEQPDGKLLVLTEKPQNPNWADHTNSKLWRFNADGSLDADFAEGGLHEFSRTFTVVDMALQPDGKVVVVAHDDWWEDYAFNRVHVFRLDAAGGRDSRFASDGSLHFNIASMHNDPVSALLDEAGRIVIPVRVTDRFHQEEIGRTVVARVLPDGTLDPQWGAGGIVDIPAWPEMVPVTAALDAAGAILIGGQTRSVPLQGGVMRVLADGQLDVTYGENGLARIAHSGGHYVRALLPLADGSTDTSFGSSETPGWTPADFSNRYYQYDNQVFGGLLAGDTPGSFLIAGTARAPAAGNGTPFTLRGYAADGQPDTTAFASGVEATISFPDNWNEVAGHMEALTAVTRDGSAYVLVKDPDTFSFDFQSEPRLHRYRADGSIDTSFAYQGSLGLSMFGAMYQEATAIAARADGGVYVIRHGYDVTYDSDDRWELLAYHASGDGDGDVDFADFLGLRSAFGSIFGDDKFNSAFDVDDDDTIGFADFLGLRSNFGTSLL